MTTTPRPRPEEDARLVEALRREDPAAAEALVAAYGARIHRRVRRILSDPGDAEEVAQDVLLTVLRRIRSFRGRSTLATWIQSVATNAALAHLRRRRRDAARAVAWPPGPPAAPASPVGADTELARRELGRVLAGAIERLPEPYRLPLVLRHVEGHSTAAIAARLGLGRAAVKSRVHRSRRLIRASLGPYVAA
jgi:RNA polymerase sigma-70 factor (ECF subfamily)